MRIKPLLKYDVYFERWINGDNREERDTFTAEEYSIDTANNTVRLTRTGNVIREYFVRPNKIVVSPVDEEADVPQ